MKFYFKYVFQALLLSLLIIVVLSCKKKKDPDERENETTTQDSLVTLPEGSSYHLIQVSSSISFQTMDHFGASDCWSAQHIGKWPNAKANVIADWLFSMDTTNNGQPLGIGLSSWRFNIGAGSVEQGDDSGIEDPWRRSESFLLANGNYDWTHQSGQQWFLNAAKERGVESFIGFVNSPPIYLTKNGKAHGSVDDLENLSPDQYEAFSQFLIDVYQGIETKLGIQLDYLAPVNEPQWDWTGGQEGCHYSNESYRNLVDLLQQKVISSGISSKILITEAGKWTYLYAQGNSFGNQIDYFFGPDSPIANSSALARNIAGHSYYTTGGNKKNIRSSVWNKASQIPDLKVWSTEYCPLGNEDLSGLGWSNWHRDYGMDVALYVHEIIHADLVYANASVWQWWTAISPYDYPDGLVYVSKDDFGASYRDSKLLWSIGNFSRFVRPGAQRIEVVSESEDILVSAFKDDFKGETIIIISNANNTPKAIKLDLGNDAMIGQPFITSDKDTHKLLPMKTLNLNSAFEMPAKSIISFIIKN